jgi:hypothetical protein
MDNACKVESRTCGKQILNLNNTREATKYLKEESGSRSISFLASSMHGIGSTDFR